MHTSIHKLWRNSNTAHHAETHQPPTQARPMPLHYTRSPSHDSLLRMLVTTDVSTAAPCQLLLADRLLHQSRPVLAYLTPVSPAHRWYTQFAAHAAHKRLLHLLLHQSLPVLTYLTVVVPVTSTLQAVCCACCSRKTAAHSAASEPDCADILDNHVHNLHSTAQRSTRDRTASVREHWEGFLLTIHFVKGNCLVRAPHLLPAWGKPDSARGCNANHR